jgi:hypothetical protein
VPVAYLALLFALQPADRLSNLRAPSGLGRLVYDDYDLAAVALRGLNFTQGRTAGHDHPPCLTPEEFQDALDRPAPLEPTYHLEYPHAALLLFRLGWPAPPDNVPAAVLDGWHNNLVEHVPRTPSEQQLWTQFRWAIRIYQVIMVGCLLALMAVLRAGYEPPLGWSGAAFFLVLPGALYFAVNRFDIVPALLTGLSLFCLGRKRPLAAAGLLGVATALKVYPILLAPLVVRYLWPQRRTALAWVAVFGLTAAALVLPPVLASGWQLGLAPYRFQLSRPTDYTWVLYGHVLPRGLGEPGAAGALFRIGTVALLELFLIATRPADLASLLRRGALVVLVFVALQVFYSPQWILWLAPMLIPLARRSRWLAGLIVALDLVNFLTFPPVFDLEFGPLKTSLGEILVHARAAVLAALALTLVVTDLRAAAPKCPSEIGY